MFPLRREHSLGPECRSNQVLCTDAQLSLHHNRPAHRPHHYRCCTNPQLNLFLLIDKSSTWGSYLSLIQSAHTILFFWVRTMASDLVGLILIQPTSYSAANGLSVSHCLMKQGELHHLRKILSPPHLACSTFHLMTEPRNSVFKYCD